MVRLMQKPSSPWLNIKQFDRVEYQLRYLMDANINAHKLKKQGADTDLLIDNIAETLTSLYGAAVDHLIETPNPRLLTALLTHHKDYLSGSVSEELAEHIEIMQKLDKGIKPQ